jgi:hypothetical protein
MVCVIPAIVFGPSFVMILQRKICFVCIGTYLDTHTAGTYPPYPPATINLCTAVESVELDPPPPGPSFWLSSVLGGSKLKTLNNNLQFTHIFTDKRTCFLTRNVL